MLAGEAEVRSERKAVVEQTGDCGREKLLLLGGEDVYAGLHEVDGALAGADLLGHVEQRPVGLLQLNLGVFWCFGQDISRPVDQAALSQRLGEGPLYSPHQAGGAVRDDQQRRSQAEGLQALPGRQLSQHNW